MLKNFKLGVKLIGGFGSVLFLFAAVMLIYQFIVQYTLDNYNELMDVDIAITEHAATVESHMLQCRNEEKDFLSSLDISHYELLVENVKQLIKEAEIVDDLAKKSGNKVASDKARLIIKNIHAYKNNFDQVVEALKTKGFDDNSGLRDDFNKIVTLFMNNISLHEVDQYYIELLKLQKNEANYIRIRSKENRDSLSKNLETFFGFVNTENPNPVKEIIFNLIKEIFPKYKKAMHRLFKAEVITAKNQDYQEMQEYLNEFQDVMSSTYFRGAKEYALEIRRHEKDYLLTGNLKYAAATRLAVKKIIDAMEASDIDEDYIKSTNATLGKYLLAFNTLVDIDKKISERLSTMQNSVMKIGPLVKELNINTIKSSSVKKKKTEQNIKKWEKIAFLIGITAIIFGLGLSFVVTMGITKPIIATVGFAENMEKGDLSQRLKIIRKDEIGTLSTALNSMVTNLNKMFKGVSSGIDELTLSSSSLSVISQEMLVGAQRTATKSNFVSKATEKLNSNTNSIASTMEETAASMSLIASTTEDMNLTIKNISKNTDDAKSISEAAVNKAESATIKIGELEIAANDIGKVTDAISDISSQTNLLALNATIESARAGEAGKGFAVVAGEIKILSQQTAEATKEISSKIEGIQTISRETMIEINGVTSVINKMNKIIRSIADAVNEQSETTRGIAANISKTSVGIHEINEMIIQSSEVTGDIVQDISEVSEASEMMTGSSSKVNENADDLMQLAGKLKEMINRFVL